MQLTKIQITDDFPLMIVLCGKSIWKYDENHHLQVETLLNRNEDNYTITSVVCTELKPSENRQKIKNILKWFFPVCDAHMSPQGLWGTDDCDYNSLLLDYQDNTNFDEIFIEITKQFPELREPKNLLEKIPNGLHLRDVIATIEIAYPKTWNIKYKI